MPIFYSLLLFLLIQPPLWAYEIATPWRSIDMHGFMSLGYLNSQHNNIYADTEQGTFQFNEAGLNFSTELMDYLQAGIQFHTRDLGDLGNHDINVDWAFIDYRYQDSLGFRGGKIKLPLGFYNTIRDYDFLRTSIFLPNSLYKESLRDILNSSWGGGIYGFTSIPTLGDIDYQMYYSESDIGNDSATLDTVEDKTRIGIVDIAPTQLFTGHVQWLTPIKGLRLGLSVAHIEKITANGLLQELNTPVSVEIHNLAMTALSLGYTHNQWIFETEFSRTNKTTNLNTGQSAQSIKNTEIGYYIGTTYHFTPGFKMAIYYDVFYADKNDKQGTQLAAQFGEPPYKAWRKDWVISARFDINEAWNFKLEGHFINGTAEILDGYNPQDTQQHSFLLALKTTVNF